MRPRLTVSASTAIQGTTAARDVEQREQRDRAVHRGQVQHDAEAGRRQLGQRQRRALAGRAHQPVQQRIAFDVAAEQADADVGQGAVEGLGQEEQDDDGVAEALGAA